MTHVPGQVENDIDTTNQVVGNVLASDISANDFDAIGNPLQVEWVSSLCRQKCVDNNHLHTQFNETTGEIAADKTHATGNQHGTTVILGTKFVQF